MKTDIRIVMNFRGVQSGKWHKGNRHARSILCFDLSGEYTGVEIFKIYQLYI